MSSMPITQTIEQMLEVFLERRTLVLVDQLTELENRLDQMEQSSKKSYLQQKEVCSEFGIGHRTLKQWVTNGLSEIWLENRVYYDRKDIESYLELHKV